MDLGGLALGVERREWDLPFRAKYSSSEPVTWLYSAPLDFLPKDQPELKLQNAAAADTVFSF